MIYLFDIDGTLLLTGGAGSRALDRVFRDRYGIDGAMAAIRAGGKTDDNIVREIFETRLGRAPEPGEVGAVLEEYVPRLRAELAADVGFRIMPRVAEALAFLTEARVVLGIATGNIRVAAEAKLDRARLRHHFATGGYGCDDADRTGLVRAAIGRARAHAGCGDDVPIVVVGDTTRDVVAARACGVQVVAVATGSQSHAELAAAEPDAVLGTLAELPDCHRRLSRRA